MKKLLLAVPLVAGASWAGASYYSGTQTHSAYERLLVQLNDMKPFTLVNESYSSGFLKSYAITQVLDSSAPDADVLFRLQHEIEHSPLGLNDGSVRVSAANIKTTLVRDDSLSEFAAELMEGFTQAEPFVVDTQVSFDGKTDTHLVVSPYRLEEEQKRISVGGIDIAVNVDGDAVVSSGTLGAVDISSDGTVFSLSQGNMKADLTRFSQALYTGLYEIEYDSLSFNAEDNMAMQATLKSIDIRSDTDVKDDLLSGKTLLSVGSIDSVLPVDTVSLESTVSKLSIEGVKSYIDTIGELSVAEMLLEMETDANANASKKILSAYLPMIGPGTGMKLGLSFSNGGGDASLTYGLNVIDDSVPAYPVDGLASIVTLRDLLTVLVAEVHLDADAAAIDQTPLGMFMLSPQAQQVIIADGGSYKADVTLNELIVDINGNPLAIEMMLGQALDMPLADVLTLH